MKPRHPSTLQSGAAHIVERNIQALLNRRETDDKQLGWQEHLAGSITKFSGSMPFVYLHAALFGVDATNDPPPD